MKAIQMMTSRRILISLFTAAFVSGASLPVLVTPASALSAPEGYVQTVAGKIVSTINAGGSSADFNSLVSRYADVRTIARFSLGKYRKGLPSKQAKE